jgi:hypothetical protein
MSSGLLGFRPPHGYYSKGWPVGIGSGLVAYASKVAAADVRGGRPSPLGPARCRPPRNGTRTVLRRTTGLGLDLPMGSVEAAVAADWTRPSLRNSSPAPVAGTSTTTDDECSAPKARPSGRAIARPRHERVDHDDLVQATVDPRRGGSGDVVHHRLDPAHLSGHRAR